MTNNSFLADKKKANTILRSEYKIKQKYKTIGLVKLLNKDLTNNLIKWLKELPVFFIIITDEVKESISDNIIFLETLDMDLLTWVDFKVCDNDICDFNIIFERAIVPIVHSWIHLSSLLTEFNPSKWEWNAFYYQNENEFSIMYAIVRYIENAKFPYDNKTLVENVYNS